MWSCCEGVSGGVRVSVICVGGCLSVWKGVPLGVGCMCEVVVRVLDCLGGIGGAVYGGGPCV